MSKTKVAINGFGRIGRQIFRQYLKGDYNFEIVAINDPSKKEGVAHLLKYDSTHGTLEEDVSINDQGDLVVDSKVYGFCSEFEPKKIDWKGHDVEVVIDATGRFKDQQSLGEHIKESVKKVILTAPGAVDHTIVMGVNHDTYDKDNHHIVSNASCTTNCLAPIAKVIDDNLGIENGLINTIHAYTADQRLVDGDHSDLRRARAAAQSMIPTTTGAAKAVGLVLPHLQGKLDGGAVRVPTLNVSLVDAVFQVKKDTDIKKVNEMLTEASKNMPGILATECVPLVSCDYNGNRHSSTVDLLSTTVIDKSVKVLSWYDNESGYSARVLDLTKMIVEKL